MNRFKLKCHHLVKRNFESVQAAGQLSGDGPETPGLCFVALSLDSTEPGVPAIEFEDFGGAYAAVRPLVGLGHQRIAVLGIGLGDGPGRVNPSLVWATRHLNVRERTRGYWAALAEAGIFEAQVPVPATGSDVWNTEAAMAVLFGGREPPLMALLAMSDLVALKALDWLAGHGSRVPEDVSVMGFDVVPEAAAVNPPLTTVKQPFRKIAERSVAASLDDAMPKGREVLPLTLVLRGSTGPEPS